MSRFYVSSVEEKLVIIRDQPVQWMFHLTGHHQLRIADPAGFASGGNPMWHFAGYTVAMQLGLLLLAAAFHSAGLPRWMVLVLAGGALLTILALVIFRDVPPFLHYIWLLAAGIGLLLALSERRETARATTVATVSEGVPPDATPGSGTAGAPT